MKQQHPKSYFGHQDLSQLLPWFVNKTLQGVELKAVEAHLSICLTCKRELIQLQKLAQAVIQESSLDSAEHAAFMRLKIRLHSQREALHQQARPDLHKNTVSDKVKQLNKPKKRWTYGAIPHPALAMAAAMCCP